MLTTNRRFALTSGAAAAFLWPCLAMASVSITDSVRNNPMGYSFTPATVVTFDNASLPNIDGFTFSGTGSIVSGSKMGAYAPPTGDSTKYLSTGIGTETINFGQSFSKFGLYWGSIDPYNTVIFMLAGKTVGVFTGSQVLSVLKGSSEYVNFSGAFDQVAFASTRPSFEVDNIAVGDVPEPSTIMMMIMGLGALGIMAFKTRKPGDSNMSIA